MPGEPCWAKDGPSRRAHGAGPERGTPERSEGRTPGQGLFGYFCGCLTKVPRRKGETRRKPWRIEWICTLFSCSIAAKTTETPSTYPPQTPNWNRGIRVVCTFPWLQQRQRLETAQPHVGAGLLAMASARFNSNTAPLASRASPLPQRRCASLADPDTKQTGLPPRTPLIRPSCLARNTSPVLDREQSIYRGFRAYLMCEAAKTSAPD